MRACCTPIALTRQEFVLQHTALFITRRISCGRTSYSYECITDSFVCAPEIDGPGYSTPMIRFWLEMCCIA